MYSRPQSSRLSGLASNLEIEFVLKQASKGDRSTSLRGRPHSEQVICTAKHICRMAFSEATLRDGRLDLSPVAASATGSIPHIRLFMGHSEVNDRLSDITTTESS